MIGNIGLAAEVRGHVHREKLRRLEREVMRVAIADDLHFRHVAFDGPKTEDRLDLERSVRQRLADNIVVIRDCEVAEQGRHDALIAKRGVYAELYGIQTQAPEEAFASA